MAARQLSGLICDNENGSISPERQPKSGGSQQQSRPLQASWVLSLPQTERLCPAQCAGAQSWLPPRPCSWAGLLIHESV